MTTGADLRERLTMTDSPVDQWPLADWDLQTPPVEVGLPNWALLDDFGSTRRWTSAVYADGVFVEFVVEPALTPGLFDVFVLERLTRKIGYFRGPGRTGPGGVPMEFVEECLARLVRRYGLDPYRLIFRYGHAVDRRPPSVPPARTPAASGEQVYVIEGAGLYKIGYAGDVESRLRAHQTGSPVRLRLVGTVPVGREREHTVHQAFRGYRQHGEWFDLAEALAIAGGWRTLLGDDFEPWRR